MFTLRLAKLSDVAKWIVLTAMLAVVLSMLSISIGLTVVLTIEWLAGKV